MQGRSTVDGAVRSRQFSPTSAGLPISVTRPHAHVRQRAAAAPSLGRRVICGIDRLLRRAQSICEFTTSEHCLLRLAISRADASVRLHDGVSIENGGTIAVLHLWNEHLPPLPKGGPTFAWANRMRQQLLHSLDELAAYAAASSSLRNVVAFQARGAFVSRGRSEKMVSIAAGFGFERIVRDRQPPLIIRVQDFVDNFWLWGLVWAFNPRSLRGRALIRQRDELWISKATLIERFGPGTRHRATPVPATKMTIRQAATTRQTHASASTLASDG
jgi:hypothetical protein